MPRSKKAPMANFDPTFCLPPDQLKEYLKSHYRSILRLIKTIYFNKQSPEKMNMRADPNSQDKLIIIKDKHWVLENKDYVLDTLILELWSKLYNCFISLNQQQFRAELTCNDTYARIEAFMEDFRDFCNNGPNIAWNEQKRLAYNFITFLSKKQRAKIRL